MQGLRSEDSCLHREVISVLLSESLEIPLCSDLAHLCRHFPWSNDDWECLEDLTSALVLGGVIVGVPSHQEASELHDHHVGAQEDEEGGPAVPAQEGEQAELLGCDLEVPVHALCQLEVVQCHFVSCEVRCQFNFNSLACIGECPFRVMVLLGCELGDSLDEVLGLLESRELEGSLQVG